MTKELWVFAAQHDLDWEERKNAITESLEAGANTVYVKEGESSKVKELGSIKVIGGNDADLLVVKVTKDEDLSLLNQSTVAFVEINSKEDERRVVACSNKVDYIIIDGKDWKIIPYENLIAEIKNAKLISIAKDIDEVKVNLGTLERGTDGILLNTAASEIKKVAKFLSELNKVKFEIINAEITQIKEVGMGDRVCVDTCSMLNVGEGMLIGSQSNGFFLVHSETIESPYVATRPFRVNAGAVHSYIMVKDAKTRYLSEISAGDEVMAVNNKGEGRIVTVGRSKIESRPLMLFEVSHENKSYKVILQNAETIRLVDEKGNALSVSKAKIGDKIKVYIETGGRHFGMKIEETITEQ